MDIDGDPGECKPGDEPIHDVTEVENVDRANPKKSRGAQEASDEDELAESPEKEVKVNMIPTCWIEPIWATHNSIASR